LSKTINVAIVGASGYTGLELIKIIEAHPVFKLTYLATSKEDDTLEALHPSLCGVVTMDVEKADATKLAKKADLAFLALPHKTAMGFVKELIALNVKVVDLSADYRLTQAVYEAHYVPHIDPENLEHAVYGLPELFRSKIEDASLVANPGCYPTASLLGLTPFMPYIDQAKHIFIDAKSGVSGAGKKLSDTTHFVTVNDNMFAYNPLGHRHQPEIQEKLLQYANKEVKVHFVPHLVPITRGMLSTIYLEVSQPIDELFKVLEDFYMDEPFVRIRKQPVAMKDVAGTHFCDIYAKYEDGILHIQSAIDNLLRGASSQAVANANLMMGLEESLALPRFAYVP
jgi:N-acetyl-gamma-glutamyl-phosphate reductase